MLSLRVPLALTTLSIVFLALHSTPAYAGVKPDEQHQHGGINAERSTHGLPPMTLSQCISKVARQHSFAQQQSSNLYHNSDRNSQIKSACGIDHWGWYSDESGENVGRGGGTLANSAYVLQGFLQSPGHHANIDGAYTHVGIGSYKGSDGWLYITQIFVNCQANCSLLEQPDPQAPLADWAPGLTPPSTVTRPAPKPKNPPPPQSPPPPPIPTPPPPPVAAAPILPSITHAKVSSSPNPVAGANSSPDETGLYLLLAVTTVVLITIPPLTRLAALVRAGSNKQ